MNKELTIDRTDSGFSFANAEDFDHAMKIANVISNSDLAPAGYKGKPDNIIVAVEMGKDLGLKPMQALQNIAVINGRPCLWGDALLAVVKAHSKFEYIDEVVDNDIATCRVKREGEPEVVRTFSKADAEKAGLWGRNTWAKYPSRMLQMRARGFACRDSFPDALRGINLAEEQQDVVKKERKNCNADIASKALRQKSDIKVIQEVEPVKPIEVEMVDVETGEVSSIDEKTANIQTLERVVDLYKVPNEVVKKWFDAAGVQSISEMTNEQITKCIGKYKGA